MICSIWSRLILIFTRKNILDWHIQTKGKNYLVYHPIFMSFEAFLRAEGKIKNGLISWVMKSAVLMSECKEFTEFYVVKLLVITSFNYSP